MHCYKLWLWEDVENRPNMHTSYHVIPQSRLLGHPKIFDNQAFEARHKPNKQGGTHISVHCTSLYLTTSFGYSQGYKLQEY